MRGKIETREFAIEDYDAAIESGSGSKVSRSPRATTEKALRNFSRAIRASAGWRTTGGRSLGLRYVVTTDAADISIIWQLIRLTKHAGSVSA